MAIEAMSGKDAYIKPSNLSTNSPIIGKGANELKMDDFFNLLVAQMTNQDMMNPTNDTEFIAQMAQFTALQGIQTIQEYQLSAYAVSYVGKNVAVAYTNDSGNFTKTEGVVENVTFYDGQPKVVVNNMSFPLYAVMEIKQNESTKTYGDEVPTGKVDGADETDTSGSDSDSSNS